MVIAELAIGGSVTARTGKSPKAVPSPSVLVVALIVVYTVHTIAIATLFIVYSS